MQLPQIPNIETRRDMVTTFLGYNHNDTVNQYAPNQFYDMKNLTSDRYPSMSARRQRATIKTLEKPNGLFGSPGIAYVDGTCLYYGGKKICDVSDGEKQFVDIGAYLVVMPDGIMYNTSTGEVQNMGFDYHTTNEVLFTMCNASGRDYIYYTGSQAPDTEQYQYWLDTSGLEHVLKMWSSNTSQWTSVSTTYVKIQEMPDVEVEGERVNCYYLEPENPYLNDYWCDLSDDTLYRYQNGQWEQETKEYTVTHKTFGENLKEYDGLNISGCNLEDFNTNMILYGAGQDYMIVAGLLDTIYLQSAMENIHLNRKVPEMDYVCSLNNRIWGCSSANHEIYACRLGDPTNWESYAGLASDSYAVTVGSSGDFTGAVAHLGNVLFFKENCMIKIYGTAPSNFSLETTNCRGVQKGSEKSLCVLNEILYYKSVSSVCSFDGSLPQEISADLGLERYENAVAGAVGNKYYICMQDANLKYGIFVYDTVRHMWHREDNTQVLWFAESEGTLYFIDGNNRLMVTDKDTLYTNLFPGMPYRYGEEQSDTLYPHSSVYPGRPGQGIEEGEVEWEAETNIIGMDLPDHKFISNITLRLSVEKASNFQVYIQYDSSGEWKRIMNINSTKKKSFTLPIRVRRCDHFKLKFAGRGDFILFSYAKTIEQGSEWE